MGIIQCQQCVNYVATVSVQKSVLKATQALSPLRDFLVLLHIGSTAYMGIHGDSMNGKHRGGHKAA